VSTGYQNRDAAIVDYQLWQPGGTNDWLRGPPPPSLAAGSYVACVGAAQTFGCLVRDPWPAQLGRELGLPTLNLGLAGAGPARFRREPWRQLLAGARVVVFQVLSGRSADCPRFRSDGGERLQLADGRRLGADAAWRELLQADLAGVTSPVWRGLRNRWQAWFGRREVRRLVAATRQDWLAQFTALLQETRAPKVLLWWSRRRPHYRARYHSLPALFGEYPQLVDASMVAALRPHADDYVQCVTRAGSPEPLFDRHTGSPTTVQPAAAGTGEPPDLRWTHNAYYPSQAMHEACAAALREPVRRLLARRH
jgi:hypothetical protein